MKMEQKPLSPVNPAKVSCAPRSASRWRTPRRAPRMRLISIRQARRLAKLLLAVAAISLAAHWLHRSDVADLVIEKADQTARYLMLAAGLTVQEIVITGRRETGRNEIAQALAVDRGDIIFKVEPKAARSRVEALGWVRSASVRRQFPRTLLVNIVERSPFALWQRDGRASLIDRDGAVISEQGLERFGQLPVIVGEDAPEHVGTLASVLARQPTLFHRIEAATRISGRRWDVRLTGGLDVSLPEHGIEEAWDLLAALVREHRLLERDIVGIDLRVKDRLTVRLGPTSAALLRDNGRNT